MQRSKTYRAAAEKFDKDELYAPLAAIKIAKTTSKKKFDETVDVVMRLGVDPRKADQMVRGTVNLPHGTGKTARVLVFANGDKAEAAREAGADIVGGDELIDKVAGGWLDFDAVVATPDMMGKVGRLGRVLGPRGLMPNPKTGTVTPDVAKAVDDIKGGKIEFRVDRHANLHFIIGKASFSRGPARRELRRRARGGPAAQAGQLQGPLHQEGHRLHDHGPRHPGRPEPHQQRRVRGRGRLGLTSHRPEGPSPRGGGPSASAAAGVSSADRWIFPAPGLRVCPRIWQGSGGRVVCSTKPKTAGCHAAQQLDRRFRREVDGLRR